MRRTKKQVFSLLLALAMCIGMLPTAALAASTGKADAAFTEEWTVSNTDAGGTAVKEAGGLHLTASSSASNNGGSNPGPSVFVDETLNTALAAATGDFTVEFKVKPLAGSPCFGIYTNYQDHGNGMLVGCNGTGNWFWQGYYPNAGGSNWGNCSAGGLTLNNEHTVKVVWNTASGSEKLVVTVDDTDVLDTTSNTTADQYYKGCITTVGEQKTFAIKLGKDDNGGQTEVLIYDLHYTGQDETTNLYSVGGTVVDSNGTGVEGATVTMGGKSVTSGENGAWSISDKNFANGTYPLTVTQDGYMTVNDNVDVTNEDITNKQVIRGEAIDRSIKVTVNEGTLEGADVVLEDGSYNAVTGKNFTTVTDGYTVDMGTTTGSYKVRVSAPGYETKTVDVSLSADDANGAKTVDVTLAALPSGDKIDFTKATLTHLDGTSASTSGASADSVTINYNSMGRQNPIVVTDFKAVNATMEFDATLTSTTDDRWGIVVRSKDSNNVTYIALTDGTSNWGYDYWAGGTERYPGAPGASGPTFTQNVTRHFKLKLEDNAAWLWIDGVPRLGNDSGGYSLTNSNKYNPYGGKGMWGFGHIRSSAANATLVVSNLYLTRDDLQSEVTLAEVTNGTVTAKLEGADSNLTSGANVYAGDTVVVTATPSENHQIKSVKYNDGTDHVLEAVDGVYSFVMPSAAVTVSAEFEEQTYHVPLYGKLVVTKDTADEAAAIVTALTGNEYVKATASDTTVTLLGIKTLTTPAVVGTTGWKFDVTGDATAQDVSVYVGRSETVELLGTATVDHNSDNSKVTTATAAGTATKGQKGTDVNFDGDMVPLSDAEFTFTKSGDAAGVYTITGTTASGTTLYVHPNGTNRHPLETSENTSTITFGTYTGTNPAANTMTDACQIVGSTAMYFDNADDRLYWDKGSSVDTGNAGYYFRLYTPVTSGTGSEEIPGYEKVTSLDDIVSGNKYLISPVRMDTHSHHYVLYPGHSGADNSWHSTLKVVKNVPITNLTLTGAVATEVDTPVLVIAGGNGYNVTVSPLPTHNVTWTLSNVTSTNNATTVTEGSDLTATLSAAEHYTLPETITVTVGGTELTAGANTYTYEKSTGALTVKAAAITGDVVITATATQNATPAPAFEENGDSYTFANSTETAATFTLNAESATGTTYKVYDAATEGNVVSGVTATASGTTLTLTFTTKPTVETQYWISATATGCAESTRTAVTVNPYAAKNVAKLKSLSLTDVTGMGEFAADTLSYTATAASSVTSTTVTAEVADDSNATMELYLGETKQDSNTITLADGENVIKVKVTAEDGTTTSEYTVTVTKKIKATVTAEPTANTLTYTGAAQALVTAGTASGGSTMQYSLTSGTGYAAAIPEGTNAGSYTVYYKAVANDSSTHEDSAEGSVAVTIGKAAASLNKEPTGKTLTYTGAVQDLVDTTDVTATGGTLQFSEQETTGFSATVPQKTNKGTYTVYYKVVADDSGNYADSETKSLTVTINAAKLPGTVAITGTAKFNETLTATVTGAPNGVALKYQWKRTKDSTTANIGTATTTSTYTLAADDIGATITVEVSTDNANYTGTLTSVATDAVAKQDGPTAALTLTFDYANETVTSADTWEWAATESAADEAWTALPATSKALSELGWDGAEKTVYFRVKATDTVAAGTATRLDIPARPTAPQQSAFTVTDPAAENGNGSVTVGTDYEYKLDSSTTTWTPGTGSAVEVAGGSSIIIRAKATMSAFASAPVTVPVAAFGKHAIKLTAPTNGTVTVKVGENEVHDAGENDTVKLVLAPAEGYQVGTVTVTGTTEVTVNGTGNERTFTMPNEDITVTVTFTAIEYTITKAGETNGTLKVTVGEGTEDATAATVGQTVNVAATPAEGYELTALTYQVGTDTPVDILTSKSFNMPANNVTITATFAKKTYTVTTNLTHLTASGATSPVEHGTALNITLSADTGYKLPDTITVTMGGTPVNDAYTASTGVISIASVTGEVVITAAGVQKSANADLATLSLSAGTLTPEFNANTTSYTATVENSVASVTVTATAADADNAQVTGAGEKTLTVGANTVTVTVTAEDGTTKDYTITVTRKPDKTALTAAIAAADAAKDGVETKADGTTADQVKKGVTFVTATEMKALTDAISAAQTVADDENADETEITNAVTALNTAKTTFESAQKTGTLVTITASADGGTTVNVVAGNTLTLTVNASTDASDVTPTYAWTKDGTDLGHTTASFTKSGVTDADAGEYICTVSAPGAADVTVTFTVTVSAAEKPATAIDVDPASVELTMGTTETANVTVTVTPTDTTDTVTVTSNDTSIATASLAGNTITITAVAAGSTTVTVRANDNVSATVSVTVNAGTVTPETPVITITDPTTAQTVSKTAGDTLTLTVEASVTEDATLSYQWKKDGTAIAGATSATYTKENVTTDDSGTYTCDVTATGAETKTATFTVTVASVTPGTPVITITSPTAAQTVSKTAGDTLTLTVTASVTEDATLSYQWKKDGTAIDGATSATYTKENVTTDDSGTYTCDVTATGAETKTATFNVTVTGTTPPTPEVDKGELETLYNANKDKTQGNYTDESWAAFTEALADAEAVLAKEDATQDEVDAAKTALQTAIDGLTEKTTPAPTPGGNLRPVKPSEPTTPEPTVTENPDGSTTTTVTAPDGTKTVTTEMTDGTTEVLEIKPDGTTTETVTKTDENGDKTVTETVTTPEGAVTTTVTEADGTEIKTEAAPEKDTTVTVTLPEGKTEANVTVPAGIDYTTVAINTETGEIVNLSVPTEHLDAMQVKVEGNVELTLVRKPNGFVDIGGHWAENEIDFAAAHEFVNGTTPTTFSPNAEMTRGMMVTILARVDGADTTGGATWYDAGKDWAVSEGISDGTHMEDLITREQLATMLWRYAGCPEASGELNFSDAGSVSGYAATAMRWAVENGIFQGMGDGTLAPRANATRAQAAAVILRFCALLVK